MKSKQAFAGIAAAIALAFGATAAHASLTPFQTFTGNVGYSSDGFGSSSGSGTISALVPVGATVLGAYLYTTTYAGYNASYTSTLNGTNVSYTALAANNPGNGFIGQAARADVTSIVKPLVDTGAGGVYNFRVTESNTSAQDGEALVVVYSLPSLPVATFAILDGFAATGGDTTSVNFASPLNTTAPGFFAQMFIGDNFSFDADNGGTQVSTISVNGTVITTKAGGYDDGEPANGALITVGGFDDPFSPFLPTIAQDHERYDLSAFVPNGSSSIVVNTNNPSNDDNIFLAGFYVSGIAGVNAPPPSTPSPPSTGVPEPETLALFGLGAVGVALAKRRRAA